MKTTGIRRKIDELGRVVLPMELRRVLAIKEGDEMEINVENNVIRLKKVERACTFCGSEINLSGYQDKQVCCHCLDNLSQLKL